MLATLILSSTLLASVPAAPRAVVSFEFDGIFWDGYKVRSGVRSEIQGFLRERLSCTEPIDIQEQFEKLKQQGAEFGMMSPGILPVMREALRAAAVGSGMEQDREQEVLTEALATWLQSHDSHAEALLEPTAVSTLQQLRTRDFALCAITNTLADTKRMPSLAPLIDFTLCTYEFTVGAQEAWDVAFQVAQAGKYPPGLPWVHVGGVSEGGLGPASALGFKTVAVGDGDVQCTHSIASLAELPDVLEQLLGEL